MSSTKPNILDKKEGLKRKRERVENPFDAVVVQLDVFVGRIA
jgi:hypothetical protein